ncbi:MAG: hypothetical protein LUE89_11200, partial [Clostridiales bacterium]|nr:hypothetical protein [Clostridiales bacterium]
RYRCKTRKRFVKLLMADGKTRNFAEWEADIPLRVTGIRERYQSEYLLHRAFWIPAIRPKKKKKG